MTLGWGIRLSALIAAGWLAGSHEAQAQASRPIAVEATAGWAGFVDDATVPHRVLGLGARIPIGRRLSIGPEVLYMIGPRTDRDLFVLGSMWIDVGPSPGTARVVPYVVVGAGAMQHGDTFASGRFSSREGSFTAGGGARVHLTDRIHVGGDVRIGWELHLRTTAHLGVVWPRR